MQKDDTALFESIGELRYELMQLKVDPDNSALLSSIKKILNDIFDDSKCEDVIFTNNTDKIFFGLTVMPVFNDSQQVVDIVLNSTNFAISKYRVEIDSKLLDNYTGLNIDEITSILLHEVASLVYNDTPARKARYLIDLCLTQNNTNIKISSYISYVELLAYGLKEAIRKSASIFYVKDNGAIQEFDDALELTRFLESAIAKLDALGYLYEKGTNAAEVVTKWTLRLYKDILTYRIPALHTINKSCLVTASELEQDELKNVARHLTRIDDSFLIQESGILADTADKKDIVAKLNERKSIKSFFDTFAETVALGKTAKTINEAHDLFFKANSEMSQIKYYLENNELDAKTAKDLDRLYCRYDIIRTSLHNKI